MGIKATWWKKLNQNPNPQNHAQHPMASVAPAANGKDKPETKLKIDMATTNTLIYKKKIQKTWRIKYLLRSICRTTFLFFHRPRTHCSQSPGDQATEQGEKQQKKEKSGIVQNNEWNSRLLCVTTLYVFSQTREMLLESTWRCYSIQIACLVSK